MYTPISLSFRPPQDHTLKLLNKLRQRIPGLVLRTTFISGFPGETDQQHKELVAFCKASVAA